MVESLYKQMSKKMWKVVVGLKYLTLSYDEITTINNQSWVSIHYYVVQNWYHLHVLIFLEHVIRGGGFNNLTKVIIDIMKKYVSFSKTNIVMKLMSFNANSVNVF